MCPEPDELIVTVAEATAACLSEVLHELAGVPPAEAYCRLAAHVEAALRVFDEERARRAGRSESSRT